MEFRDFDAKLRMTASALGCASRKDLLARFRAANAATSCTLDSLHKWLQGRALPRDARLVADWARLIGGPRDGPWLAGCTLAEFARVLAAATGKDVEGLLDAHPFGGRGARTAVPAAAAEPRMSGVRYLCGSFACYSPAWSPYAQGKLIRGSLRIAPGRSQALSATYTETLLGKPVRLLGQPTTARRTLHLDMREAGGELPLFFSLFLPRPPAGALCGVMSGVTFLGPEPEPSASRVAMIRVPATPRLDASNRYLEPAPGTIAADLDALGLTLPDPAAVDRCVLAFLSEGALLNQVSAADQAALATLLDPVHVARSTIQDETPVDA